MNAKLLELSEQLQAYLISEKDFADLKDSLSEHLAGLFERAENLEMIMWESEGPSFALLRLIDDEQAEDPKTVGQLIVHLNRINYLETLLDTLEHLSITQVLRTA